ncbi:hypothetical protein HDU93_005529 [Gonapodya sp. JEL0774]|nr:hypothetical protein HDU93_005529 [Gonapodya sp. JEL0774]
MSGSTGSPVEVAVHLLADTLGTPDSPERAEPLSRLIAHLKKEPHVLVARPDIVTEIVPLLESADDGVVVLMIEFVEDVGYRIEGMGDVKWDTISSSALVIAPLLSSPSTIIQKRALLWLATIYPAAYWRACSDPPAFSSTWPVFTRMKDTTRALLDSENDGVRVAGIKVLQVLAVVHSSGSSSAPDDLSLDTVPAGHPYLVPTQLKQEGLAAFNALMEVGSSHEFTLTSTTAAIHGLLLLSRARPTFLPHLATLLLSLSRTPVPNTWPTAQQRGYAKMCKNGLVGCIRMVASSDASNTAEPPWANDVLGQLVAMGIKPWELPPRFVPRAKEMERARHASMNAKRARSAANVANGSGGELEQGAQGVKRPRLDATSAAQQPQLPLPLAPPSLPVQAPPLSSLPFALPSRPVHPSLPALSIPVLAAALSAQFGIFPNPPPALPVTLGGIDWSRVGVDRLVEVVVKGLREATDLQMSAARQALNSRPNFTTPIQAIVPTPTPLPTATISARDPRRRDPRLAARETRESTPSMDQASTIDALKQIAGSVASFGAAPATQQQQYFVPQSLPTIGANASGASSAASQERDLAAVVPDISLSVPTSLPLPLDLPSSIPSAPLSSYLVLPPAPTPQESRQIRLDALKRLLDAEESMVGKRFATARGMWQVVVGRVVSGGLKVAKDAKLKEEDGMDVDLDEDELKLRKAMENMLVDHVCKDWRARNELVILYLHQIYRLRPQQYLALFHSLMIRLPTIIPTADQAKFLTKFLVDAPEVDKKALDILQKFVEETRVGFGGKATGKVNASAVGVAVVVSAMRDLVVLRPAVREWCIEGLLEFCSSPESATRKSAIIAIRRWYPENAFVSPIAEKFALEQLESVATLSTTEHTDTMETDGSEVKKENADGSSAGVTRDDEGMRIDILRRVELAFALSSRRHELLRNIFALFCRIISVYQRIILTEIEPLIRSVGMGSTVLLDLIKTPPKGAEKLVVKVVEVLVDRNAKPSKELVDAVRSSRTDDDLSPQLLLPIIAYLPKVDVFRYLPKIVNILEGDTPNREIVKAAFIRLVIAGGVDADGSQTAPAALTTRGSDKGVLTAAELLVHLHNMEEPANGGVVIKRIVEATQVCLDTTNVFTQEVLAVVLQQLVDQTKIPTVFMRTLMQAVTKYKGLVGFAMGLLTRLIGKRVWTDKTLWEGFVRCCRITQPQSFQVLLQLPKPQLQDILTRTTDMRPKLVQYINSLPPAQRNTVRIANLLPVLMDIPSHAGLNGRIQVTQTGQILTMASPPQGGVSGPATLQTQA